MLMSQNCHGQQQPHLIQILLPLLILVPLRLPTTYYLLPTTQPAWSCGGAALNKGVACCHSLRSLVVRRRCCPPQGSGALTMPARWALGGWPRPCSAAAACEKWVSPNKVAPARDVHARPGNGVGGGAYIPRLLQLWVPGTPARTEAIPKRRTASPPGARRKGSRALFPLAT